MKYKRYGKFRISDYWGALFPIIVLCTLGIVGLIFDISIIFCFFYFFFSALLLLSIVIANIESFVIADNRIIAKKLFSTKEIIIPEDAVVIISYADLAPFYSISPYKKYFFNGRISVSFLQNISFENALNKLHKGFGKMYSNTLIEHIFEYEFIYSFICEDDFLCNILNNHNYVVILPESLSSHLPKTKMLNNVFIDAEY